MMTSKKNTLQQHIHQRWHALAVRERRLVWFAVVFVFCSVLWWVLLAPALRVVRTSSVHSAQQAKQLERMRTMQAQAIELQKQPSINSAESQQKLMQLTQDMIGADSITVQGAQAVITLKNVQPHVLSDWLLQARTQARALPAQAQIEQSATGWAGQIVMRLP